MRAQTIWQRVPNVLYKADVFFATFENHALVHFEAVEATVQEQQHAGTHAAQQAEGAHAFADVTGPEAGVDDGVRAAVAEIHALHLGKGPRPTVTVMPPKRTDVGRRVG